MVATHFLPLRHSVGFCATVQPPVARHDALSPSGMPADRDIFCRAPLRFGDHVNNLAHYAEKLEPALAGEKPFAQSIYRVTDHLYRGARPATEEDIRFLREALGINMIVSILPMKDLLPKYATGQGMSIIDFPEMNLEKPVEIKKLLDQIKLFETRNRRIYIHCAQGINRTGTLVAFYRVMNDAWELDEALAERRQIIGSVPDPGFNQRKFMQTLVQALEPDSATDRWVYRYSGMR